MLSDERLFTPRFFLMFGFTFTVFLSAFQLFPTAPFRILELGGSESQAGLFLGFLTYASAFSAPLTGALADRIGTRRTLIGSGAVLTCLSVAYGLVDDYRVLLALPLVHGVFWSALLSASSAYMTSLIPEHRRAEGLSYWGLATVGAMAVAPSVGFALMAHGWGVVCGAMAVLNLGMTLIATRLPEACGAAAHGTVERRGPLIEWRILWVSVALFLCSFGYGGITSFTALFAQSLHVLPKSLYLNALAVTIFVSRLFLGRLADRIGARRVFLPALGAMGAGLILLAFARSGPGLVLSAVAFGLGLGQAHPSFTALVLEHVDPRRRGAAFGAILAAFDTGIGTGSIVTGVLIEHASYGTAFAASAAVSTLAIPYFVWAERRFLLLGRQGGGS